MNKNRLNVNPEQFSTCPVTGLTIEKFDKWEKYKLTNAYSVSFYLIGNHILLTIPYGNSDVKGMKQFIKAYNEFITETELCTRKYVEIKDYSHISGRIDREARVLFINFILKENEKGSLKGYIGYNASFIVRTIFNIAIPLYNKTIPVILLKNYKQAIKKAVTILQNKESIPIMQDDETFNIKTNLFKKKFYTEKEIAKNINDFLKFLSSINWEIKGIQQLKKYMGKSRRFKVLYDAIKLVKYDFDDVMKKKEKAEQELIEAYAKMEQRVKERTTELEIKNKQLIEKDREILENNTILKTSLDILSHDTKNIFFNIYILMQQLDTSPTSSLLKENIDELYELTMETTVFMKAKTRIFNIPQLIEKIRVTKERIYLKDHKRIEISYENNYHLFIETTNLFKNAICNIIENALKYSPQDEIVHIKAQYEKGEIFIHIKDRGKGIRDHEKEKILKRYYRGKATDHIEGSGRGLWITQNILKKDNANLYISDNEDGGTIFTIVIPAFHLTNFDKGLHILSDWFEIPLDVIKNKAETIRTFLVLKHNEGVEDIDTVIFTSLLIRLRDDNREKDLQQINKKLNKFKEKNPHGKTVLIIDDSVYIHYYLANLLTKEGFRIIGYGKNGEEGLFLYKKYQPDLVTLDYTMPIMSGKEVAKELYDLNHNVKVIFITAMGDNSLFTEYLNEYIPEKNYQILTKPIKKDHLKYALDRVKRELEEDK